MKWLALQSDLMNPATLIKEVLNVKPAHVIHLAAIRALTDDDEDVF